MFSYFNLIFVKNINFFMAGKKPLKRLYQLLHINRQDIYSIYFYATLSGLVQLSVPIGVQAIIGFVLGASMVTSIYILIGLVVFGVVLVGIFQINTMKIIEKLQQNIFTRNAFEFAEVIPNLDLKAADKMYLPEVVNRFFDTLNVQKGLSKLLLDIPTATIQIIFGLTLLSFYHQLFIAFGVLLIFLLWLILQLTGRRGLETSYKESTYKYQVVGWLEEMGRVLKSFKFSQGTHLNLHKTDKNVLGYLTSRTQHFNVLLIQYRTLVFFKVLITAAMLIVGSYLLLDQQLNIGEFIAAEIVILTVIGAVEKLISSLDSVYDVITGLEKLATVSEQQLEKNGDLILDKKHALSLDIINLNFAYEDNFNVLENINVAINEGNKVCLTGKENSSRTTLLKILTGSYSDFEGSILVNNIPIGNYNLQSLRGQTGFLIYQQDVFVGTILENISLGHTDVTPQLITEVAEQIGIGNFLSNTPNGFNTLLEPTGTRLPQSLIRKILLLRALSNSPSLVLLEEPWDGFSPQIAASIKAYILNHKATAVIVTNDTTFAQQCNMVLTLSNGKLINTTIN